MAVLYAIDNQAVRVGAVLTNKVLSAPAGIAAIAYTITVGTPPAQTGVDANGEPVFAPSDPQDLTIWVEWQDGKTWRELSRFTTSGPVSSTAVIPLLGRKLRVSATCGIATTVSLAVVEADQFGAAI